MGVASPEDMAGTFIERFNARDGAAMLALYAPDAVFTFDGVTFARGLDEIKLALHGFLGSPMKVRGTYVSVVTAGDVATAMAAANRGITADMMRITASKSGWLEEVWLCLDKQFAYARCPAHQGGLAADAPIKIWRGASRR